MRQEKNSSQTLFAAKWEISIIRNLSIYWCVELWKWVNKHLAKEWFVSRAKNTLSSFEVWIKVRAGLVLVLIFFFFFVPNISNNKYSLFQFSLTMVQGLFICSGFIICFFVSFFAPPFSFNIIASDTSCFGNASQPK